MKSSKIDIVVIGKLFKNKCALVSKTKFEVSVEIRTMGKGQSRGMLNFCKASIESNLKECNIP